MKEPDYRPEIKLLIGIDANSYKILNKVVEALQEAGADKTYIDKYLNEAISGDFDHVLGATRRYVDII